MPRRRGLRVFFVSMILWLLPVHVSLATAQSGTPPNPVVNPPVAQTSIVVSLSEFLLPGVTPSQAFKAAINACRVRRAARLEIPPGTYVFDENSFGFHIFISNVSDLIIDGQGAEFVYSLPINGMLIDQSQRVIVRNLKIDYSIRLASPGVVHKESDGSTTIRVPDEYPVQASTPVMAVTLFDVSRRAHKKASLQAYFPVNVTLPAPQTFKSPHFAAFADGDEVLLRHYVYEGHAFYISTGASDIALEDLTIFSAPGMAFYNHAPERGLRFSRCRIERKNDPLRLISVASDGIHIVGTRGDIIIEDNDFSGQGDDSVNIHGLWLTLSEKRSATVVKLNRPAHGLVNVGDELSFVSRDTLAEYLRASVTAVNSTTGPDYVVTLDRSVAASVVGDLVGNVTRSSGTFVVRRNRFHDHRARGMLIQSPNGIVEDNEIRDVTMAGMHITTDSRFFFESIGADNLLVRRNMIRGVSPEIFANGRHMAAISVVADTVTGIIARAVHRNITIEDNTIEDLPGLAVLVASADHVVVRNNTIIRSNQMPFGPLRTGVDVDAAARGSIMVTRASNVSITGNRQVLSDDMHDSGVYVDSRNTSAVSVTGNLVEIAPTSTPSNLLASVSGAVVDLAWHNPTAGTRSSVLLEALSTAGALLASIALNANAEMFTAVAPPNTYNVRVSTIGPAGVSVPSNTLPVTVLGSCVPPAVPRGLNAVVSGANVTVSWKLGAMGTAAPIGFILSAGFSPGASNAVVVPTPARGLQAVAPSGTYFVRVRAVNRCGQSADTADIVVNVP